MTSGTTASKSPSARVELTKTIIGTTRDQRRDSDDFSHATTEQRPQESHESESTLQSQQPILGVNIELTKER